MLPERPLIVQTGLKDLFGEHEAELIQHVIYCREAPFVDKLIRKEITLTLHEERIYVHIPLRLLFDPWTGYLRHLSEITYRRTIASCKSQGILDTKTRLFDDDNLDNTNWFAIIHPVFDPLTATYVDFWNRIARGRQDALINRQRPPAEADEAAIKKEMWTRIEEIRAELRGRGLIPQLKAVGLKQAAAARSHMTAGTEAYPTVGVAGGANAGTEADVTKGIEAGYQNDRVTRSQEFEREQGIKMTGSTVSKRQGRPDQNDRVDPIKMSGSYIKETKGRTKKDKQTGLVDVEKSEDFLSGTGFALSDGAAVGIKEAAAARPRMTAAGDGHPTVGVSGAVSNASVADVAERLLQLAAAQGLRLDAAMARAMAADFPETRMDSAALVDRLNVGWAASGLDEPMGRRQAVKRVELAPEIARWRLITWPGFEESRDEFKAKNINRETGKPYSKISCFCRRWDEAQNPPESWLRGLVEARLAVQKAGEAEVARTRAAAVWKGLIRGRTDRELAALNLRLERAIRGRLGAIYGTGMMFGESSPEHLAARVWVLSQAGAEEQFGVAVTTEVAAVPAASKVRPGNFDFMVARHVFRVMGGEYTLEELDTKRDEISPGFTNEDWTELKAAVVAEVKKAA